MAPHKILIIEDSPSDADALRSVLESEGYSVETAATAAEGLTRARNGYRAVVTDLHLGGSGNLNSKEGLEVIRQLHAEMPQVPTILMTGLPTTETAIEAMKQGAYDYVTKPIDNQQFLLLIEKAVALNQSSPRPAEVLHPIAEEERIVGNSLAMRSVYKQVGVVATTNVTVLVRGETGTGKELVARAVHHHSERSKRRFVVVNCPAIPANLLASELFGHEAGAFTDAKTRRAGCFEQADQGTVFLDEIGDMPAETQKQLLRVLQNRTVQRLGGKEPIPVDVRIIAATHRDLELAIVEKEFREDLYYRLNVAVINLPPLRERREDIPDLVSYFASRHGTGSSWSVPSISPEAIEFLQQQSWPGNVRELENVVRKALLLARGYAISLDHVREALTVRPLPLPAANQTLADYVATLLGKVKRAELENAHALLTAEVERELYSQAIRLAGGDQSKAAAWLGVSRPTIREKLTRYGLRPGKETAETA